MKRWSLIALVLLAGCAQAQSPGHVWWEAEQPSAKNWPAGNPFAPLNPQEAAVLSGGDWITADGQRPGPIWLEYDVEVPTAGAWQFYARRFWQHGPFRWRWGSGPWHEERVSHLLDGEDLRQFLGANWVALGAVELPAGKNKLRVESLTNDGAIAFDCFTLTKGLFIPRGKLKPGEMAGTPPEGWFTFDPPADPFEKSPVDLRFLNEKQAGDGGFIQVRGEDFVHGTGGKPIRFWATNTSSGSVNMEPAAVDYYARWLAKRGVNMIRVHGGMWDSATLEPDAEHVKKLQYFVHAMKREGIYTCLSIYFPLWINMQESHGFSGYTGGHPFALLFFDPKFQAIYQKWWKAALLTTSPYSGLALKDDPAVAMLEIVNEDSYFFWTFTPYENIPEPQTIQLEKRFGRWLTRKYGSVAEALRRWGAEAVRGDVANEGRAGFIGIWQMANDKTLRANDTRQFLTEDQKLFFSEQTKFLKEEIGFKGSIYGSNWVTGDARTLGPLDKYSNTACDFMDRHGYYGGLHEGDRAGYSVNAGERFADRAGVKFQTANPFADSGTDFSLPIADIRYNGKPSIITEIGWPMPNKYRAEPILLAAAYGSLQGMDGFFFFAHSGPHWERQLGKFSLATPSGFGQYPAAALMYRLGMVQPGTDVVHARLSLQDLFEGKGAPVVAPLNLDILRAADVPIGQGAAVSQVDSIDPLAFYVGKVAMTIDQKGGPSTGIELSKFIDRESKVITSITGELRWDYGQGLVKVQTPKAVAAVGFLGQTALDLGALKLSDGNEFGTIALVALDDKPLTESRRMLLQLMTEEMNLGWSQKGDGPYTIESTGKPPVLVRNVRGSVSFADRLRVTPLDPSGYPTGPATSTRTLALAPTTLAYLVER